MNHAQYHNIKNFIDTLKSLNIDKQLKYPNINYIEKRKKKLQHSLKGGKTKKPVKA